jgi:hypothetical protein
MVRVSGDEKTEKVDFNDQERKGSARKRRSALVKRLEKI